jgi:AraC family transcriptional regulator, arabinose operon regulatory protein
MRDAHTRVFSYNGLELVSNLGREVFPGERVFKLDPKSIEEASRLPLTSMLLPCRIGYFPSAAGQRVTRPRGDWAYTLLYCLDGHGTLDLERTRISMKKGMFAVLPPFEFHGYYAENEKPWSYYWIHFNGALAQQYFDLLTRTGRNISSSVCPDLRFVKSFEQVLSLYQNGVSYKTMVQASACLHQLLGDLYGLTCQVEPTHKSTEARVETTIQFMRENLSVHISIAELAASVNMSPQYYSQQFREQTGESPRCYFNKLIMSRACEYLICSDDKVEAVAQIFGYTDAFYFSRLFKQITGHTPSTYRRIHRR